jgi:peptidoglycan/xylan/chitin deacetylase (PgdA/CDA1 family)
MPGCFRIARWLGPHYWLRCVLFHHIAVSETDFTRGLDVTTTCENFELALKFLSAHYTPVRLQDVLGESDAKRLPPKPLLVTFDDVYESIREVAAPLCKKYNVPAVSFLNAACLDNRQLALDNLVCYASNVIGLEGINAVVSRIHAPGCVELSSIRTVFSHFLPKISLPARAAFRKGLIELLGTGEAELGAQARLYLTSPQVSELADFDFEVGNHTYSHVHCRCMTPQDFEGEVYRNKMELEALTGQTVRSFSVPYGCSEDLPIGLLKHLQDTGHEAAFLVESLPNSRGGDHFQFNRVSIKAEKDAGFFSEVEVLPRFRSIRNSISNISRLGADQ